GGGRGSRRVALWGSSRRAEAVPVPARARNGLAVPIPATPKNCRPRRFCRLGRAAEPDANIACVSSQQFIHTMRQRTLERQNVSATSFLTECRLTATFLT